MKDAVNIRHAWCNRFSTTPTSIQALNSGRFGWQCSVLLAEDRASFLAPDDATPDLASSGCLCKSQILNDLGPGGIGTIDDSLRFPQTRFLDDDVQIPQL